MKRERKILHRMVFSYTLVFGVIILLIMGLLYGVLVTNRQEEARLNSEMMVTQPLKQLDRFFKEMDDVAYKAMTSETLIRKFSTLRERDEPGNHYDTDILDSIDTATVLSGINGRLMPVRRILAYNDKGDFISSGAIVDREQAPQVLEQREANAMMEAFREADKDYRISHPKKDEWMGYFKDDYFTLTRPIMNVYSRDVVGIVEVQRNWEVLEEYIKLPTDREWKLNLYDELGAPVIVGGDSDDVVVAVATSEDYGWTVELLEPRSVMAQEQLRLLGIIAGTWLLMSAVVFVVINVIATRIARPLTDLTAAVHSVNPGEPERIRVQGMAIDEIESLQSAFNQMLERLTLSMDQEKKSFLLAMQAQMNPHFLYNVLSVINAVALEDRSNVVVQICGNLSSMLRYSASYVQGSATLREELSHTTAYLELMKARYDYMFTYHVELDPALADTVIPKLVIQPLCENCFTHAFSDKEPPYEISIAVKVAAGGWEIRVSDNGAGFDSEARGRILARANNASYEDLNRMQIGGLGLTSSVVRLKLLTGKRVMCDIIDRDGGGSAVVIDIYDKENKEGNA